MEWIEVTARSVDEAKEMALDRLGVSDADLEVDVLEEPRSGFLGVGRSDARLRARVKPISREKPDGRRRRSSGRQRGGDRPSDRPQSGRGESPDRDQKRPGDAAATSGGSGNKKRQRGGRSGSGEPGGASPTRDQKRSETVTYDEDAESTIEEQCETAQTFLSGVVEVFELDATTTAEVVDDEVHVAISGDELGILIGPKAVTLQAFEELTQAVVKNHGGSGAARVRVDVAGYREQRRTALEEFARGIAEEVLEDGNARSLEPMASNDRKVVHDVISDMVDLETTSEGEEPRRRVVIRPGS